MESILQTLLAADRPDLAKMEGSHVSQVWYDGEHTSQKSGSILWQRTLHTMSPGNAHPTLATFLKDHLPHKVSNGNSYIFCDWNDADRLCDLINNWRP